mgnify:CR=1 FL=1
MKKIFIKQGIYMNWEQRLHQSGHRVTAARRAVIDVLQHSDVPLPPQDIFTRGQQIYQALGLVTVYRTLEMLSDMGLVRRVHHRDECQGYVFTSPGHYHHVVCRCCGGVVEFPGEDDIQALIARVEATTGYCIDGHLLQLSGLCPHCREQPRAGSNTQE